MIHPTEAVLSIDFSLDRLDVSLRADEPGWGWPHQAYPNNGPGFQQLKTDLLAALGQQPALDGRRVDRAVLVARFLHLSR
jgi:hypothetical protein